MSAHRLVRHGAPDGKEPPPALLAELRAIDDTAELVYVGEGTWWLGAVRPTEIRRQAGTRILALEERRAKPNPRNVMLGKLLLQGFARIQAYHTTGDPAGPVTDCEGHPCTIVNDFRERDALWRRDRGEQAFRERMARSDGTEKRTQGDARLRDFLLNDGREHYRREVRDRVVFGHGGMTGGSSDRRTA